MPGFGPRSFEALNKRLAVNFDFASCTPEQLGMKPRHHVWCRDNTALLRAYWEIVGFLPVTPQEIVSNLKVGLNQPKTVNSLLKGFML